MRNLLKACLCASLIVVLTGCAGGSGSVTYSPITGSIGATFTVPASEKVITNTRGEILYTPGQSHDPISNRALVFADHTGRVVSGTGGTRGGECDACQTRPVFRAENPCSPSLEVKPSLRERFRNIVSFRSPHYIRRIDNGGDTPVTRALRKGY